MRIESNAGKLKSARVEGIGRTREGNQINMGNGGGY